MWQTGYWGNTIARRPAARWEMGNGRWEMGFVSPIAVTCFPFSVRSKFAPTPTVGEYCWLAHPHKH